MIVLGKLVGDEVGWKTGAGKWEMISKALLRFGRRRISKGIGRGVVCVVIACKLNLTRIWVNNLHHYKLRKCLANCIRNKSTAFSAFGSYLEA